MSSPCIGSTQCISLQEVGGALTATPIIDSSADNALSCGTNGLFAKGRQYLAQGFPFPTPLRDGMIVDYQADAALGVIWSFRYNAASASGSPWQFIGGAPLWAQDATNANLALSTTISGPALTLPFIGNYIVDCRSQIIVTSGQMQIASCWARIGAEAEPIIEGIIGIGGSGTSVGGVDYAAEVGATGQRICGIAGSSITHRLQNADVATALTYRLRTLLVTPIRCG